MFQLHMDWISLFYFRELKAFIGLVLRASEKCLNIKLVVLTSKIFSQRC